MYLNSTKQGKYTKLAAYNWQIQLNLKKKTYPLVLMNTLTKQTKNSVSNSKRWNMIWKQAILTLQITRNLSCALMIEQI